MERIRKYIGMYIEKNTEIIKACFLQAAFFLLSLLFGGISFAGGISPFATGFLAGIISKYTLACALGTAIGYPVFFGFSGSLRFISAVCLITLIRFGFGERIRDSLRIIFSSLLTFFSTFISSLAVFIAVGGDKTSIIIFLCESLIASAFSCFTVKLFSVQALRKKEAFFAPADMAAIVFFGCIILLSVDKFRLWGFSPAVMTAYFIILLSALCGKEAASSVAGVCCALTLGFSETEPELMLSFILTGLMCSITGVHGKIPVAVSSVLSCTLAVILKGSGDTAIISLSENIIPSVIFAFIPEEKLMLITKYILPLSRDAYDEEKNRTAHFNLKRSAKAIRDISHSVSAVSNLLQRTGKPEASSLISEVRDDICNGCTKYTFCWESCRELTEAAFTSANATLVKKGHLISEELPERLSLICRLPDRITDSFNSALCRYNASLVARNEIFDTKRAAAMQFSCLSSLLDEAAENMVKLPCSDPVLGASLMPVFREMGFSVLGISAFRDEGGKSVLQVYTENVPVIPRMSVLLEKIYETSGICYKRPVADEYSEEGTVLSFYEERRYTAEYFTASHTGAGECFSGDTVECFFDGTGKFYTVLSDGMGTGTRAAVDSVMTCSLMSRLMRAGFSPERALDTVNCALLVKSADESLSTLDIFSFDLESGSAVFFKAGAAASVIFKDKKTLVVEKSSMPLGILKETDLKSVTMTLSKGDTVFIMSDGASVIPNICFKELMREKENESPEALAQAVLSKALSMSPSGKHDDITVTCIRIKEN